VTVPPPYIGSIGTEEVQLKVMLAAAGEVVRRATANTVTSPKIFFINYVFLALSLTAPGPQIERLLAARHWSTLSAETPAGVRTLDGHPADEVDRHSASRINLLIRSLLK
jgi:hypothetical protein